MKRKWLAVLGALTLMVLAMFPLGALAEEDFYTGDYVELDSGDKIWVSKFGDGDRNIVFFAGFGAPSPTYEFIPMIKEINEKLPEYTVYVYEYPGTGKTGDVDAERNVPNITAEIHETMSKLGIESFTPIVHSISGAYLLSYVNEYPEQVERIICIDNSVPKQALTTPYDEMYEYYDGAIAEIKAIDWSTVTYETNPEYYYLPNDFEFSDDELNRYTEYISRSYNDTMVNELYRMEENLTSILDATFPEDLPVIMFVSTGTQAELPDWHDLHQAMVMSDNHEMHIIDGSHYLHFDARDEMMPMIIEYLSK